MNSNHLDRISRWKPDDYNYGRNIGIPISDYTIHRITVRKEELYDITSSYAKLYLNTIHPGASYDDWIEHKQSLLNKMNSMYMDFIEVSYNTPKYETTTSEHTSMNNQQNQANKKLLLL